MSDIIASQISVTTGDIAKAAVGAAKQRLAAEIKVLNKTYGDAYNKIKAVFCATLQEELVHAKQSKVYADLCECAQILNNYAQESPSNERYKVRIEEDYYSSSGYPESELPNRVFVKWLYSKTVTDRADHKLTISIHPVDIVFNVVLYMTFDDNDNYGERTFAEIPIFTFETDSLCKQLEPELVKLVSTRNKSIDLSNKLKGCQDPITNLTLEEEITNAITMQAVSKLPDIAAVFDTTTLAGSIINGYLE